MDTPQTPHKDAAPTQQKKVSGASESRIPGLSTLPKQRPKRKFLGFLARKR